MLCDVGYVALNVLQYHRRLIYYQVGIVLHELIRDSQTNRRRLEEHSSDRRPAIGRMVLVEDDESVKIVAGQVIRAMIRAGSSPQSFWPDDPIAHGTTNTFPVVENERWLVDFQEFTDRLNDRKLVRETSVVAPSRPNVVSVVLTAAEMPILRTLEA